MKYMLLCYHEERALQKEGDAVLKQVMEEAAEQCREIHAKGQYVMASPLQPVATATSVRLRDGRRLVTDGPFAETREQLGGFYLIDVENLDEAIAIAGRTPGARLGGTIEIRPVLELAGLPANE